MAYYTFLNLVFAPLLKLPTIFAIVTISFILSLIINLITKYATDQKSMKQLKEEMKEYQKQIKEAKNEPSKAMQIQKKSMETNLKYMQHSFRATLYTLIPVFLLLGWMNATFAYESIKPQQEFSMTAFFNNEFNGNATLEVPEGLIIIGAKTKAVENNLANWTLKGNEGSYDAEIIYDSDTETKNVIITQGKSYAKQEKMKKPLMAILPPSEPYLDQYSKIKSIKLNYKKLTIIPIGFRDWLGWLGTYIWSSLIFTTILRKILKIY